VAPSDRLTIAVTTDHGEPLGELEFADQSGRHSIELAAGLDATLPEIYLVEDQSYEIAFHQLPAANADIKPRFSSPFIASRLAHGGLVGILPSSRFIGTTVLHFYDGQGTKRSSVAIEVRSRKLEYLTEFYSMIDDLSAIAVELVTTLKSSFTTGLKIDPYTSVLTVQQRLLFLKSICDSQDVFSAFKRIETLPHARLVSSVTTHTISKAAASSRELAVSLLTNRERTAVPATHPLAARFKTLPTQISGIRKHESTDTAENRFVKFVLRSFIEFIERAAVLVRGTQGVDRVLVQWLVQAEKELKKIAAWEFFKGIGRISVLPIGSPALQRKHGYRQVLDAWVKFNSASRVSWQALDEVFQAGQRDAALLYEYWCFFILRDAIAAAFALEDENLSEVLRHTADGLSITLKTGSEAAVKGQFVFGARRFGLRYSYQRSFGVRGISRSGHYRRAESNEGSWSKRMDPDYTISIWPYVAGSVDGGENAADEEGKTVHLHFDAKYRLSLASAADGAPGEVPKLRAKGDDIDKMHAYLSAIRGSCGAYILYPGEVTDFFCQSQRPIPGVGYIAVRPGAGGEGKEEIRKHLLSVMETLYARVFSGH
jgi:predicted component of viral defense system (DUF524 family)